MDLPVEELWPSGMREGPLMKRFSRGSHGGWEEGRGKTT